MPSLSSLINNLSVSYPDIKFSAGDDFSWNPTQKTITYNPSDTFASASVLHELAHALLGHANYRRDIELLRMESEAWNFARKKLADRFSVAINEELAENQLDTYREWLHRRSLCPTCNINGLQEDTSIYRCLSCNNTWRVNEAKCCSLRRYQTK